MFSEDKVTEIFCLADEFCKFSEAQQEKSMLQASQNCKKSSYMFSFMLLPLFQALLCALYMQTLHVPFPKQKYPFL